MMLAVFTKNRTNPAYDAARLGADRAARRLGARTAHFVPDKGDDPDEQSALIDRALAQAPDAFVFAPVHPVRVNAAIGRIHAARIPVFGFVSPLPVGPCVSYVGADDYRLGFELAHYVYRRLGGRGNVLLVSGHADSVTSRDRMRAFGDAAREHPGISIAGTCVCDYRRDLARERVAQWLADNEGPDACLAANDNMALGVVDALREAAGIAGRKAAVAGVNAIPEAIAAIRSGAMLASADFNAMQMAHLAAECAIRHLRGEKVPAEISLPVAIVDRDNCHLWDRPYEQRPLQSLEEALR
jgi:ribose transport system substrate-binding protein